MVNYEPLRFYITPEHKCSYLPHKRSATLFADPNRSLSRAEYSRLSQLGFRRSGSNLYRPHCKDCSACIPLRIPAKLFKYRRRHKRILNINKRVVTTKTDPYFSEEVFDLYSRYIEYRHKKGEMYPPNASQFTDFLVNGRKEASFYEFKEGKELLGISVADDLEDGMSAVYTFFNPELKSRALGIFAILWLIQQTRKTCKDFLYLGYWIEANKKMNYKSQFTPFEKYLDKAWILTEK